MDGASCGKSKVEEFNGRFSPIVDLPIVTVSVITYNSSKYVLETLKSIRNQTYPNLILQISDDYSKDNTVEICRKWLRNNQDRFIKSKIILPEHNTGVSANCNRALDYCETKYYKLIAGDDLLLPNCIKDNIDYMEEHPDAVVVFSKAKTFSVFYGIKCERGYKHDYDFFCKTRELQYKSLIEFGNTLPASSTFWDVEILREKKIRYDERIPLLEDYPMWIQLLKKGVYFHFLNKDTVLYRLDVNSLSVGLFTPNFYRNNILFYLYYFLDEIKEEKDKDKIYNIIANHETLFYTHCYNAVKKRRIIHFIVFIKRSVLNFFKLLKCILSNNIVKEL